MVIHVTIAAIAAFLVRSVQCNQFRSHQHAIHRRFQLSEPSFEASAGFFRLQQISHEWKQNASQQQQQDEIPFFHPDDVDVVVDHIRQRVAQLAPERLNQPTEEDILNLILPLGARPRDRTPPRDNHRNLYQTTKTVPVSHLRHNVSHSSSGHELVPALDRDLASEEECVSAIVGVIAEVISVALCAITSGLCGVGKKVGQSVARKLRSSGRNEVLDVVRRLTSSPSNDEAAEAVFELFGKIVQSISLSAIMDSIGANVEWYEWIVSFTIIDTLSLSRSRTLVVFEYCRLLQPACFLTLLRSS